MISQISKTVLVAEDEDGIRGLLTALLTGLEVNLIVAANGAEELQKARQHQGPIDLLISNIRMPEMSGIELSQRLCSERPDMKVLLISSFTEDPRVLTDSWRFLQKPFQPADFVAAVGALLEA